MMKAETTDAHGTYKRDGCSSRHACSRGAGRGTARTPTGLSDLNLKCARYPDAESLRDFRRLECACVVTLCGQFN